MTLQIVITLDNLYYFLLYCDNFFLKTKWPEQSEELLRLIVNSLNTLDSIVPQGCPETRRHTETIQKIILVLDKAPKHLQPDLVALVPKLVDPSEHSVAACALLDHLHKPCADPSLLLLVLFISLMTCFHLLMWICHFTIYVFLLLYLEKVFIFSVDTL